MTDKDRIQYIQVLLALDGHHDYDIHATLNRVKETTEKKPSFWDRFKKGCVTGCVTRTESLCK